MKIGVLALQGAFAEHIYSLKGLGIEATEVRQARELAGLDGLIIPGGESTAIVKLVDEYGLKGPIEVMAHNGKPIMGTCAGLILLAGRVLGESMETLGLMDIQVRRNAFGRQLDSFETSLDIPCIGKEPYPAVFIRAPLIKSAGDGCEVLAVLPDGTNVAVRQGNLLALAFHPELSGDTRLHQYFLNLVGESLTNRAGNG